MEFVRSRPYVEHIAEPELPRMKHPEEMTATELARATRQFEKPFVFERARPMTAAERAEEQNLRRKRGRPKMGAGATKVSISLEGELLKRADALAKKRG